MRVVTVVIVIFVVLSFLETFLYAIQTPTKTVYSFLHNYPEDYFYYLHLMRQGYDGQWLSTTRMTPEVFTPQLVAIFFIVLGKVALIFPLGMDALYTIARVTGAVTLMGCIYGVIRRVFPDLRYRIGALVITLSATFWPDWGQNGVHVPSLIRVWTELDPLMRLSFIPHHLWSKIFFLLLLLLLTDSVKKQSRSLRDRLLPMIFAVMMTIIMGFISPVILITYVSTIGIWLGIEIVMSFIKKRTMNTQTLLLGVISMGVAGIVALYHQSLAHSSFPWTTYAPPWEQGGLLAVSVRAYIQSFGPVLWVALLGAVVGFGTNTISRMLVCWVIVGWVFLFVIGPFLPLSNSRYLAGYQWIALGILATQGLLWIERTYKRKSTLTLLVIIVIVLSVPSWYVSVSASLRKMESKIDNPQVYIPIDIQKAFMYLNSIPSKDSCVVASSDWVDTMVPSYTSCRSVSGHRLMTWQNESKMTDMNTFLFSSDTPLVRKKELLLLYRVSHVITMVGITGTDFLPLLKSRPSFVSGECLCMRYGDFIRD